MESTGDTSSSKRCTIVRCVLPFAALFGVHTGNDWTRMPRLSQPHLQVLQWCYRGVI
jgi:hypothetical protein